MPLSQLTNPNIIFFITDEQRFAQHWPDGWAAQNLPSMDRLAKNGLTFLNALHRGLRVFAEPRHDDDQHLSAAERRRGDVHDGAQSR